MYIIGLSCESVDVNGGVSILCTSDIMLLPMSECILTGQQIFTTFSCELNNLSAESIFKVDIFL